MYYTKFHRFLVRQYIYPILLLLFIFLLIKWNSTVVNISGKYNNNDDKFLTLKKPLPSVYIDENKKSLAALPNFKTQIKLKVS